MQESVWKHLEAIARSAMGCESVQFQGLSFSCKNDSKRSRKRIKLVHHAKDYKASIVVECPISPPSTVISVADEASLPLVCMDIIWGYFGLHHLHFEVAMKSSFLNPVQHLGSSDFWQKLQRNPSIAGWVAGGEETRIDELLTFYDKKWSNLLFFPKESRKCLPRNIVDEVIRYTVTNPSDDFVVRDEKILRRYFHGYPEICGVLIGNRDSFVAHSVATAILSTCKLKRRQFIKPWLKDILRPHVFAAFNSCLKGQWESRYKVLPSTQKDALCWMIRHFGDDIELDRLQQHMLSRSLKKGRQDISKALMAMYPSTYRGFDRNDTCLKNMVWRIITEQDIDAL